MISSGTKLEGSSPFWELPLPENRNLMDSLGQLKAAHAVARACASNRLAVMVPCHRVIRGSGDLAGYKWGIERKQKLLKQEAREQ